MAAQKKHIPIKMKNIIRLLVAIIIILAFLAGFYHSAWQAEQKKSDYLEQQLEEIKTSPKN